MFFDIILRHFNTMAHENVNILLLNYAHKYLRHTQIQKRTINKAAKILWILLTGLKFHKQSNKRDNEIMNYFKRSSPQHCYKHKKIYSLTDSPSFYLFKTKISLNLIINSLVTHQQTFNFIQVRWKNRRVLFSFKSVAYF